MAAPAEAPSPAGVEVPAPTPYVTPAGRRLVLLWALAVSALFTGLGIPGVVAQHRDRAESVQRHTARMDPAAVEPGLTAPDLVLPPGASPVRVGAGVYVDRVAELSLRDNQWLVDFYLWFTWRGEAVSPGAEFEVVDGRIEALDTLEVFSQGDLHYRLYRVAARITKFFDVSRFPRDDHQLTIGVESPAHRRQEMIFVADQENSSISSRVQVPGYALGEMTVVEKPHSYRTTRGDPRLPAGTKATYSQLRFLVGIERADWGVYLRMFQALHVAVAVALLSFLIRPSNIDARYGLGVGALFAAVANSYIISSSIPDTGVLALADVVNGIGVTVVLLVLLETTIALHLHRRGDEAVCRLFDRVSLPVIALGYGLINLALPLAASY